MPRIKPTAVLPPSAAEAVPLSATTYVDHLVGPKVTISVGKHPYVLSKGLLCGRSDYFDEHFRKRLDQKCYLEGVDKHTFELVVEFIYTDRLCLETPRKDSANNILVYGSDPDEDTVQLRRQLHDLIQFASLTHHLKITADTTIEDAIQRIWKRAELGSGLEKTILPQHIKDVAELPRHHTAKRVMARTFVRSIIDRYHVTEEPPELKAIVDELLNNDGMAPELVVALCREFRPEEVSKRKSCR